MKRILFLLIIVPVFGISQPVTNGLIGYYPFNGNANDESGNGNDLTVNNAYLIEDRVGNATSAYEFIGLLSQGLTLNKPASENVSNTFTISFWVSTNIEHQVDKESNSGITGTSGQNYALYPKQGSVDAGVGVSVGTNGVSVYEHANSYMPAILVWSGSLTGWNHIVVIYKNKQPRLYINGKLMKAGLVSSKAIVFPSFQVGYSRTTYNYGSFKGFVDDIAIYNREIDDNEVLLLYGSELPLKKICESFYCDGNKIGIGTSNIPSDYLLAVNGKAIMEGIKVQLNTTWPDYVFDDKYELKDLYQLENFIKTYNHLPNLPDASTISREGYELSEMDTRLLEKIEELTLYIIRQNKALDSQNERIKAQQLEIELIKQHLKKVE